MATASEYRAAARTLDRALDTVGDLLRDIPGPGFDTVLTGPQRVLARAAIDVSHANVRSALSEIQAQIDEAYRRASICDDYTAAVRRYHQSDDPERAFPARPASWVTYG